jgi:hypothetical protein
LPGPFVEVGEHQVGPVDLVAGGAEVLADRAQGGAPAGAVFDEPDGLRPVGVGAGAGVDAQLGLQRGGDLAGVDEPDQAAREGGWLRPCGHPDGQPPGGDVINAVAAAVSGVNAVADQTLVQGQVGQQSVLRQTTGVSRAAAWRSGCGVWLAGQSAASLSGCPLARSCSDRGRGAAGRPGRWRRVRSGRAVPPRSGGAARAGGPRACPLRRRCRPGSSR